jgi:hypothetical protein
MELQSLLPPLQAPATCPYPESDQSSSFPPSHFLNIHLNIILPCKSWSSKLFLSLRSPNQKSRIHLFYPHTCYMTRPSHYSLFYHQNNIWWGVQIDCEISDMNISVYDATYLDICSFSTNQIICYHGNELKDKGSLNKNQLKNWRNFINNIYNYIFCL